MCLLRVRRCAYVRLYSVRAFALIRRCAYVRLCSLILSARARSRAGVLMPARAQVCLYSLICSVCLCARYAYILVCLCRLSPIARMLVARMLITRVKEIPRRSIEEVLYSAYLIRSGRARPVYRETRRRPSLLLRFPRSKRAYEARSVSLTINPGNPSEPYRS
jgi:hypothetical protein